ncbi:MAG: hypothetical protein KC649_04305, partial [Candidatus Omnitrophica bacterium]|nr:hypothetical protein [Candidatus Omnitrophota bacterium]
MKKIFQSGMIPVLLISTAFLLLNSSAGHATELARTYPFEHSKYLPKSLDEAMKDLNDTIALLGESHPQVAEKLLGVAYRHHADGNANQAELYYLRRLEMLG